MAKSGKDVVQGAGVAGYRVLCSVQGAVHAAVRQRCCAAGAAVAKSGCFARPRHSQGWEALVEPFGTSSSPNWEPVFPRLGSMGSNLWELLVSRTGNPCFQDWEALVRFQSLGTASS